MPLRRPRRRPPGSGRFRIGDLALALVAYVPLLLTHRGKLGADTKTYLYIDPGRLLSRSPYLWDPAVGLGTVTHQNIGYLLPMGPYYWVMEVLGVPDWVAQRLWMGSIIFLAGLGVRYLLNTLRWSGPGITVAAFGYALSPYLLHYIYKHSVILLPFTALPWLLAFSIRSIRQGGWRHPSLFALVALAAGGINATSLLLVMIGPLLWVLHSVVVERETTWRKTLPALGRIGLLTLVTSLWWMAGLLLQGSYGIDILRYTETYRTVAAASTGPEVFRGLGYWFFYGTDALGPWFKAAVTMTQSLPAIALSFAVPGMAVLAALLTRFRYRFFFVGMAFCGLIVSVGSNPSDSPTLYGRFFAAFTDSSAGLAMRSAPRAEPLWVLAAAVFLGAGTAALTQWRPNRRLLFAGTALGLIAANLSPLWMGRMLDPYLERDADATSYWRAVGRYLDGGDQDTRALEIPGIDFANYRWGASVDTILPGLTDRDTAGRELVPWGSVASADMTNAMDAGFQDASFDPAGYAALLANLSVGDLVVRNDLEYERYRTPRPKKITSWIADAVRATAGRDVRLRKGRGFGPGLPNQASSESPMLDDTELALDPGSPTPREVVVHPIDGARPEVALVPADRPTILAGSAAGIVALANSGLLDDGLLQYAGSVTDDGDALATLLDEGARLVVTDTNRRAGHRWGALRDQLGYTEMADETPFRVDPSDSRLDLFGRVDDARTQTVVIQQGGLKVRASGYGNQLTYTASDRAANAFDLDERTGWKVGAFSDVRGEWIEATSTDGAITADHIVVLQAQRATNRWITKVRLTFDGADPLDIALDASSRSGGGQSLPFPKRTFQTLRIEILETDLGVRAAYTHLSGVGFTRIDIDGRSVTEVVRPPTDLLDAVGKASADHELIYLFTRQRTDPADQNLQSAEMRLVRQIDPPTRRAFGVTGKVRLDTSRPDEAIDAQLGVTGSWGATFRSSGRLDGDVGSRASSAFDGDTATAWQSGVSSTVGSWLGWTLPASADVTVSKIRVIDDENHSVPTVVHFEVDGVAGEKIRLPIPEGDGTELGHQSTLRLPTPRTLRGTTVRLVVDEVRERTALGWYTRRTEALPVAISELTISDPSGTAITASGPSLDLAAQCRDDLVSIGDTKVPLRISASIDDALAGRLLPLVPCEDGRQIEVAPEPLGVSATDGRESGWSVDQLALRSPSPAVDPLEPTPFDTTLRATRTSRGSYDLRIRKATEPFWLVLGQSHNKGWKLTVAGHDLGEAQLVSGYANGWRIDPVALGATDGRITATLRWAPQRTVWVALGLSAIGLLVCLVLLRPRFAGRNDGELGLIVSRPIGIAVTDEFGAVVALRPRILVTAGAFLLTGVFAQWWWAPAVGLLTWAALSRRGGWIALRIFIVALVGATAAYVLAREARAGWTADFDWPQHFSAVSSLPAAALAALFAEAMVEALRGGWRRSTGLDPSP
ncbi:MAG: DUF3367 domain-containing protein [Microthrixaceae bacterium]|nr:DUF3367 domain-containing protein [Microthrixaceae bacterium]